MEEKLKCLVYPRDCFSVSIYCQIALSILEADVIEESQEDLDLWLQDYDSLYWVLTNQPPGLPAILRSSCNGDRYPALSEFWIKYERLRFPERYDLNDLQEDSAEESEG